MQKLLISFGTEYFN